MQHVLMTIEESVAHIIIHTPQKKANVINRAMQTELNEIFNDIEANPTIQWVIFDSQKPNIFIAGADIRDLNAIQTMDDGRELIENGQKTFNRLANLSAKTIALIDGVALGGGLELALACDFIVITDSKHVSLGLPEVNLGIIPGWGGTQRLPHRIGLLPSLLAISSGKPFSGRQALRIGLADAMVSRECKLSEVHRHIHHNTLVRKRKTPLRWSTLLIYRLILRYKAKQAIIKKTKGKYLAPLVAVDVLLKTYNRLSLDEGLGIERAAILSLLETDQPRYLTGLFLSQESVKKRPALEDVDCTIDSVGIVGAGLMGGGIAWWFLNHGKTVRIKDITWDMVRAGYQTAMRLLLRRMTQKHQTHYDVSMIMDRLTSTLDFSGFRPLQLVIEAVPEDMTIKQSVLRDIEANVSDSTIIATNTSSLSVDEMARALSKPDRFLGIHFFSPVHKMPLVEIIPSDATSPSVVDTACKLIIQQKKIPIVVKNCPGFLVNRILLPYVKEAIHLMLDGFAITDIDRAAVDFGMPIGPLALADEVGLDIGLHVMNELEKGLGDRMAVPSLLHDWVTNQQWLGKKSGTGFYTYSHASPQPNRMMIPPSMAVKRRRSSQDPADIVDRLILIMINEGIRCLDESVVASASELDLAMVMGAGFPPFRGGLIRYLERRGIANVFERMTQLAASHDRFTPCDYFANHNQDNHSFYR